MANTAVNMEIAGHVTRAIRFIEDIQIEVSRILAKRRTRKLLSALTDAQLDDIGLSRYDVYRMH